MLTLLLQSTGQLNRFRNIINSVKAFKEATTKLVIQMLRRKHSTVQIYKGWEQHVKKYQGDGYMNYNILRAWFRRMINWAYKNSQYPEAITYAEQRHRIQQLDVAYSPVSPVVQQESSQATVDHQQDNGPNKRILTTQEIDDAVNDAFNQAQVEIISINSTQEEQQRRRSTTRQRTPRTSLTASSFSNSRQSYEIRVSKGTNKR